MRAGADNMMHQVHRSLIAMGHDVVVVAVNNEEQSWPAEEAIDDVVITRAAADYGYEMVEKAIEQHQPDVLFGQFMLLPYAIEHAVERDLPVVVWCHLHDGFEEPRRAALVEMVDLFVFNSAFLYEEAHANVRHVIVNPPIERERVVSSAREPEYITLINLCESKGPEIFYHLAKKFPEEKFLGVEGGYEDQVKKDLPNVQFVEHGPDIASVYAKTKVLLMPSRYESFGMAAVEAQANGIPVIASDLPSLRDVLGKGALYVEPRKKQPWETALRTLLVQKDYYSRVVGRAQANVERFSFKGDMRVFEVVLQDIVHKQPKRTRPSIHRLLDEYAVAREEARLAGGALGRAPTDAEVAKIVESPYRPDSYGEAVQQLAKLSRIATT
jgi:glycosyltransferase involved in cell wall biosynthesis